MTFLPVVARELRVVSRRRATYWTRFVAASMAIGLYVWIWFVMGEKDSKSPLSTILFGSLAVLSYAYTLLAGVSLTSDCLSEEKREGTLGLLFLTDLKGYDVVLGKLVATSVNSFYRLLAVFPVLAIPLLLGGLTYAEFWRMVLVLTNTLFFSLCAGCFVSSISRNERKSMAGTFLLIFCITAIPPLLGYFLAWRKGVFLFNPGYLLLSSGYSYALTFDAEFNANPGHFWVSVAITHILGWVFLTLASVIVRYSWQDKAIGELQTLRRERWQRWKFGTIEIRNSFRNRLLEINPFFWLAGRNRLKPVYVLGALGMVGCSWFWLFLRYRDEMLDSAAFVATAIPLHLALKFWVASEACRPINDDRRSGALELLLSTPLSIDEILTGQMLALKRQFGWAIGIILLADFGMFLGGLRDRAASMSGGWPLVCAIGILTFLADIYTLIWVSMWLGLTAKKASAASRGALLRVLVLPGLIFFGLMTASLYTNLDRHYDSETWILASWFAIGIVNDIYFAASARANLRREFRKAAAQRFDSRVSGRAEFVTRLKSEPRNQPVEV